MCLKGYSFIRLDLTHILLYTSCIDIDIVIRLMEAIMSQVLVSTKYQIVIPKDVREQMHIKTGQKMSCIAIGGIIHLVPVRPISELRGMAKGISIEGLREKKDRL